ncbi:uncharacterized protein LOC110008476 [Amborella trichopoda]|uniref:uncharacterized protein LOC110008476 n=1 Tax=Amborella trichopoda TaxID=13333 RepID=UPI0009C0F4CF|nr:uncharacterized protein LOC110008476 [Amborella trichopoda]|eukprot:XP_020531696.1 uncharacterized protein LOC110008476 [Amborella trichopoda]
MEFPLRNDTKGDPASMLFLLPTTQGFVGHHWKWLVRSIAVLEGWKIEMSSVGMTFGGYFLWRVWFWVCACDCGANGIERGKEKNILDWQMESSIGCCKKMDPKRIGGGEGRQERKSEKPNRRQGHCVEQEQYIKRKGG